MIFRICWFQIVPFRSGLLKGIFKKTEQSEPMGLYSNGDLSLLQRGADEQLAPCLFGGAHDG